MNNEKENIKLNDYLKKIEEIKDTVFNKEQKKLARKILEKVDDADIDSVYNLLIHRIKTGFVFDIAPEINHEAVAIIEEDEKLRITSNELNPEVHKLIIGENYDALKNLLVSNNPQNIGGGGIDLIYIDPPYNTEKTKEEGNDYKDSVDSSKFIYRDKFTRDGWLNMMNERLKLARDLLNDDGLIFISIDDNEQAYLKVLCDEIFGEENFIANLNWIKKRGPGGNTTLDYGIVRNTEYILVYARDHKKVKINYLIHNEKTLKKLGYINKDEYFNERGYYKNTYLYRPSSSGSFQYIKSLDYKIKAPNGELFSLHVNKEKKESGCYTWGYEAYLEGDKLGFIECKKNSDGDWVAYRKQYSKVTFDPHSKQIINELAGQDYENIIDEIYSSNGGDEIKKILGDKNIFAFPKPVELIKYLINIHPKKNITILDFFAGSGTTGQAVMELNQKDEGTRKFILVTNNENNIGLNITYERLFRVINGIGTKNEPIAWKYSDDYHYLCNNSLEVYIIKKYDLRINDTEKADKLITKAQEVFSRFNHNYKKEKLNIYNELASLTPYKEEE